MARHNQRSQKGRRRERLSASALASIRRAVEREARRYGVSYSFVVANAVAWTLGVSTDGENYKPKRRRGNGSRGTW
jgi:hypothetical protein